MIRTLTALLVAAAPAAAQQICLTDHTAFMDGNPQGFEAAMRSVVVAHAPVEFRNSCDLLTEDDLRFYTAMAEALACTDSPTYHQVFAQVLKPQSGYLFAARAEDFPSAEMFDGYCALVAQIDMAALVDGEDQLDQAALDAQSQTFQSILTYVAQFGLRP